MAIQYFIPEVWASRVETQLRNSLVYGQGGVTNRNYEGEIARAGDTVHILSVGDPGVRAYSRNAGVADGVDAISYDLLSDGEETLTVDQADYFAFQVDDVDKRQALPGFVEEASRGAAYKLAQKFDTFVATKMAAAVPAGSGTDPWGNTYPNNQVGSVNVAVASGYEAGTDTAVSGAYDLLVKFRTLLNRSNAPTAGRFVVVPPEIYALLLKDDRFIRADASGTTAGLRNGEAGTAAGFSILESNVVPEASSVYTILAGHSDATTVAEQIMKTEALRRQDSFSDAVRGLHVYGGKVLEGREALLCSAKATIYGGAVSQTATAA